MRHAAGSALLAILFLSNVVPAEASTSLKVSTSYQEHGLVIGSASLVIVTVPPVPHEPLISVDAGEPIVTDSNGVARTPPLSPGTHAVTVIVPAESAARRVRFVRWGDRPDAAVTRQITVPNVTTLSVGFEFDYPVQLVFNDPSRRPIDETHVEFVLVANGRGEMIELPPIGPTWLAGNRITRPASGLISDPIEYRIERVLVGGQDVVDRGRQRFAAADLTWNVKLFLFHLEIRAKDALLGYPVGSSAILVNPDGQPQEIQLYPAGFGSLIELPRGDYKIALSGELGLAPYTPIALSKDQTVTVLLVSLLDAALILIGGLAVAISLVVIGRPTLLRRIKFVSLGRIADRRGPGR
jgi:hypothetical protein